MSSTIKLYEHNQKTYDALLDMLGERDRACIIKPTGTGKFVIIAKMVQDNPDKRFLLLGTNDMKPVIHGTAFGAVQGVERLIDLVRHHAWSFDTDSAPEILVVAPPPICETANEAFAAMFAGALEQSAMLASLYADLADEKGCGFFDAGSVATTTPLDGIHLDAENTRAIGRGLEPIVRMMLGL